MSFNVAQLRGDAELAAVAAIIAARAPDVVAVQECVGCPALADALPHHELVTDERGGDDLLYDARRWQPVAHEWILLGDDDGWGDRFALWTRLASLPDRLPLDVYATHFCVTIRRTDDRCDEARQVAHVETILGHAAARPDPQVPLILAGDLNVFDGFEAGAVIGRLLDAGLVDVHRSIEPDAELVTFPGNSFAPAGRIDYVLTSAPALATAAGIEDGAGAAEASDHYAVWAAVALAPRP
jgi:endonuclease/exonuclease/phosphatase family metal-dependent hydrolase